LLYLPIKSRADNTEITLFIQVICAKLISRQNEKSDFSIKDIPLVYTVYSLINVSHASSEYSSRSATLDLRQQAARGRPHSLRKGVYIYIHVSTKVWTGVHDFLALVKSNIGVILDSGSIYLIISRKSHQFYRKIILGDLKSWTIDRICTAEKSFKLLFSDWF
jgi:hypothetical protein